jgi:hypothetical protein
MRRISSTRWAMMAFVAFGFLGVSFIVVPPFVLVYQHLNLCGVAIAKVGLVDQSE